VHELEPKLIITIMHGQQHIKKNEEEVEGPTSSWGSRNRKHV